MSSNSENSVLFSLRELRTIEEERLQEEEHAVEAAGHARFQAEQQAERRVRDEAEAKRNAIQAKEQAEREQAERIAREERMKIEAEQRRQQVEQQATVEAERLRKEMEGRAAEASNKRPVALISAVAVMVLIVIGLTGFYIKSKADKEFAVAAKRAETEKAQKDKEQFEREMKALDDEIAAAQADKRKNYDALLASKDEKDRAGAQARLARAKERERAALARQAAARRRDRRNRASIGTGKCDPDDPLCGI